jgi:hypothetical protein
MAVFPLQVLTSDAKVGFDEAYRSSSLGIHFSGQPKGTYIGFIPSVLGSILTLALDPAYGYSNAKVDSNVNPSGMDVVSTGDVTLDFSGQPDVDFPMNVMARVQYYDDGSVPTTAEVFSRSASVAVADTEVLLCVVDGPAVALTVASDPALQQRDVPLAHDNVDFGFMPGGSVESLQAAADIVAEVIAARTGIDNIVHADLSTRIAEDYSASGMASRLALVFRALRSNDYTVSAGEQEITVSGSFTEVDRDFLPAVTLDGDGNETTEGAVAGPVDDVRNVAVLIDATTGYRPVDDPTNRQIIFGRLVGPDARTVAGEWRFLNASKNVTAIDGNGQATTEIEARDTILGPDGKHYEVDNVPNDNFIELRTAYQAASESATGAIVRRWKIQLKKTVGSSEEDASLPADTTVRFFFPTFLSTERSNADWQLAMHTAAEREPLAAATTTVPGTIRLAEPGALLGSINIQNVGAPLGGGPFHTINFNAASAAVIPVPSNPGEVEVAVIGNQGSPGLDGASGGPGDPGGQGVGYSAFNSFEISTSIDIPGNPAMPWSFTQGMGHNIRYLHGNLAIFQDFGFFAGNGLDRLEVADVEIVGGPGGTDGRISGTIAGDTALTVFLSSAGD